jgi:hypothetical protein
MRRDRSRRLADIGPDVTLRTSGACAFRLDLCSRVFCLHQIASHDLRSVRIA